MTSIYVAGPMRGYKNYNFQAFEDAEDYLTFQGAHVISPHEIDMQYRTVHTDFQWVATDHWPYQKREFANVQLAPSFNQAEVLKQDFKNLLPCDVIAFLPGSDMSAGARAEAFVAYCIGLRFIEVVPWVYAEESSHSDHMYECAAEQFEHWDPPRLWPTTVSDGRF